MSDEIPFIPPVPQGLKEAAQRGTLIPFVGAGVSVLAGCPTWAQLADGALTACIAADKFTHGQMAQIRHLLPRMKISIARAVEAEHELKIDYSKLINPRDGYKKNDVGQRVYRSLGKLSRTFVTTNYDAWLDTEIQDNVLSVTAAPPAQDTSAAPRVRRRIVKVEDFTPANLNQPDSVFHLHGSLADPSGMVMTTRDYIRRYANDRGSDDPALENRTLTFLEALFQNKTVLFVGYGLEDLEILEYVIQKARQQSATERPQARHFMLQGYFAHEYELMRSLTQYPDNFKVAIGGLAYAGGISRTLYQLLTGHNVFANALAAKLEDKNSQERVIEWVGLAYLWGDEQLESPIIKTIFASGIEDIETLAELFWQVRQDELTQDQVSRVLSFWERCLSWITEHGEKPDRLMARLSRLSPYIRTLDERGSVLLMAVMPFVHTDYGTVQMVEELTRLIETNVAGVAALLEKMLEANAPTYDLDDKLKTLIEMLAQRGLRAEAIRCAEKVRRTLPGMLDLYKKLVASG